MNTVRTLVGNQIEDLYKENNTSQVQHFYLLGYLSIYHFFWKNELTLTRTFLNRR